MHLHAYVYNSFFATAIVLSFAGHLRGRSLARAQETLLYFCAYVFHVKLVVPYCRRALVVQQYVIEAPVCSPWGIGTIPHFDHHRISMPAYRCSASRHGYSPLSM